jgi:hypothetical protein
MVYVMQNTQRSSLTLAVYVAMLILAPRLAHSSEASHTIDVLVVYPGAAQDHLQQMIQNAEAGRGNNWGETEMGPFLDANLARVSQMYTESGIDVEFKVVHHQQIDLSYIDADWKNTFSEALMNSEIEYWYDRLYRPYIEAIEAIRDAHVADIVIYWRDFDDGGPIASGAGGIGVGEDEAYTHITYGQFDPYTIAHEIGHLLGGQHSDGVQGEATFSRNGDTANLREYITVMTVANPLPGLDRFFLWRFSSNGASVIGDNDCKGWHGVNTLLTCNFSSAASLGDENHNVVPILSAMVPVMAGFRIGSTPSDRFNALLQAVQAINDQQAQAISGSSVGAEVSIQLAKQEGAIVQAKAAGKAGEPTSIQTMPYYLMLVLACLAGLLGLRQLRV